MYARSSTLRANGISLPEGGAGDAGKATVQRGEMAGSSGAVLTVQRMSSARNCPRFELPQPLALTSKELHAVFDRAVKHLTPGENGLRHSQFLRDCDDVFSCDNFYADAEKIPELLGRLLEIRQIPVIVTLLDAARRCGHAIVPAPLSDEAIISAALPWEDPDHFKCHVALLKGLGETLFCEKNQWEPIARRLLHELYGTEHAGGAVREATELYLNHFAEHRPGFDQPDFGANRYFPGDGPLPIDFPFSKHSLALRALFSYALEHQNLIALSTVGALLPSQYDVFDQSQYRTIAETAGNSQCAIAMVHLLCFLLRDWRTRKTDEVKLSALPKDQSVNCVDLDSDSRVARAFLWEHHGIGGQSHAFWGACGKHDLEQVSVAAENIIKNIVKTRPVFPCQRGRIV